MTVKTSLGPAEDPWHDIFRFGDKMTHPAYWSKTVNSGSYHVSYVDEAQRFADKVKAALEDRKPLGAVATPPPAPEKKSNVNVHECTGEVVHTVQLSGGTLPEMLRALALRIQNDPEGEAEFVEVYTTWDWETDSKYMIARLS